MRQYLGLHWTDSHQNWAGDVSHHAPSINGIQNTKMQKNVFCDIIISVLYWIIDKDISLYTAHSHNLYNAYIRSKQAILWGLRYPQVCTWKKSHWMRILCTYHIHSNKRPGHLDKLFRVGAYLFQYLLQGSTQKFMIFTIFRLIPNHIELSTFVPWINWGRWSITL